MQSKKDIILKDNCKNYKTIFIANGILSFAVGLYYPFLIGFLYGIGGMPLMGSGLGLILIFDSLGSCFVGKLVDKYGSKLFFLISSIVSIAVFMSYPFIPLLKEIDYRLMYFILVITLIIDGTADGFWGIAEATYLADITITISRGNKMGSYWGISGIITGAAIFAAGFLDIYINFLTVAIIVVFIYLIGVLMLLRIKENSFV